MPFRVQLLLLMLVAAVPAARADVADLVGKWRGKIEMPDGMIPVQFEVRLENGEPVWTVGNYQAFWKVTFEAEAFSTEMQYAGSKIRLTGSAKDGKMSGTWMVIGTNVQGRFTAEWEAVAASETQPSARPETAAESIIPPRTPVRIDGLWDVTAATFDGEFSFRLRLVQTAGSVRGAVVLPDCSIPLANPAFSNNVLRFEIDYAGETHRVELVADGDKLTGSWSPVSGASKSPWVASRAPR